MVVLIYSVHLDLATIDMAFISISAEMIGSTLCRSRASSIEAHHGEKIAGCGVSTATRTRAVTLMPAIIYDHTHLQFIVLCAPVQCSARVPRPIQNEKRLCVEVGGGKCFVSI